MNRFRLNNNEVHISARVAVARQTRLMQQRKLNDLRKKKEELIAARRTILTQIAKELYFMNKKIENAERELAIRN